MSRTDEVVEELRTLFNDGATPLRLVQHIIERHEPHSVSEDQIKAYFRHALNLSPVGAAAACSLACHSASEISSSHAGVTRSVVTSIARDCPEWDHAVA